VKALPWLFAAVALGAASFLFVENREAARRLEALERQLEQARAATIALDKARAAEQEARRLLDLAQQRAAEAERRQAEIAARSATAAAKDADKSARAARQRAEAALAERLAAEKAALEVERARVATERAQAERMAAEARAAAERARQAVPRVITSSDARKQAADLEAEGRNQDAVRMYIGAARGGSCEAAARLGEIYDKGLIGVTRNYAESLKWYNAARVLGCEVPVPLSRVKPPAVYTD
jgi:membrane protein involved in colicin uptake